MQIRRCAVVWLEPRELASFQLDDLLAGGTGVVSRLAWFAHAPHLRAEVEIAAEQVVAIGALSAVDWVEREAVEAKLGVAVVAALLDAGLLVVQADDGMAEADAAYRAIGWHAPAALGHMGSRWQGVDALRGMADAGVDSNEGLLRNHGLPPTHALPSAGGDEVVLPTIPRDAFDALLDTRATCRNYDEAAELPLVSFAQVMARAFGARGIGRPTPGFEVFKRTSPSGGSLHPTECYLIVQRVEGIPPGLYRYRMDAHALEPVTPQIAPPQPGDTGTQATSSAVPRAWRAEELRAFARIAVAGQDFFANAPVLCVLAPRFQRNYWKYRNHAKAYRVCVLDTGHLSQTLQLCATQAGLGPFVTAAINEVDIERGFNMAAHAQGPLVVCGFGKRADTLLTSEFDPNRRVWPR